MPQSLSRILLHLIFSTKNRVSYFTEPAIRSDLHGYLAATATHLGCQAICVGGVADEYRAFLKRHNVSFDERYVWD